MAHFVLLGPMHPYRGGIAHFLEKMYSDLPARGHQVSAVTFKRQYPTSLFPGRTQYVDDHNDRPGPALRLLDTLNPLTWYATARHIVRLQPDAVIFNYWMPFFAPAFGTIAGYLRRRGIKSLALVHNALPHERRLGDVALSKYFLRRCDGLVALSDAVVRDLQRLGVRGGIQRTEHPIYDIFGDPLPQSAARKALDLPEDAPVLLFFGFIRRYKGLHVVLEAMPAVLEALPEARLVIAGEFYEQEVEYRAQIEAIGSHVLLRAEYIPDEAIGRYFSAADVVVQPYLSATQSGVAQIAYHFEKPLIVTDVGGLAEVVPDGIAGLVVPPASPEALAAAIVRYFNEHLHDRLVEGVRREKQKYSWDRLYGALEAML